MNDTNESRLLIKNNGDHMNMECIMKSTRNFLFRKYPIHVKKK